jgi:hypothetical protein
VSVITGRASLPAYTATHGENDPEPDRGIAMSNIISSAECNRDAIVELNDADLTGDELDFVSGGELTLLQIMRHEMLKAVCNNLRG